MIRIKERIREVRKTFGLTQTAFGERIGVKGNTVTGWETGIRIPSDAIVNSICREFHVNEAWLRTGVGAMKAETTQREKIANFFTDVLSTAPDERSALVAALDDMPPEFWPLVVELAKKITANYKKEED